MNKHLRTMLMLMIFLLTFWICVGRLIKDSLLAYLTP